MMVAKHVVIRFELNGHDKRTAVLPIHSDLIRELHWEYDVKFQIHQLL